MFLGWQVVFKLYGDKSKLDQQNLVFSFDGEKIRPQANPDALGMEDDEIIEVQGKPSWWGNVLVLFFYSSLLWS